MKRKIFIVLFFFAGLMLANAQTLLTISGHITNDVNGAPIIDHEVSITIQDGGYMYNNFVYTDNNGFYVDSVAVSSQGEAEIGTYDCEQLYHSQTLSWSPNNMNIIADFVICDDTIPDCENFFTYTTIDNLTFTFTGEVIPQASADYSWDFGDGTYATGQEVTHTFEPNGAVDFYTV
ncbi:MAG: PKD domain-containing protein, partial [Bacteroidales bacterium]|nr:PKD domain-containing protein [Bacteroidales bacterium]